MAAPAQNGNGNGMMITGINVPPLVDIALVLLIVFMVTAKIMVTTAGPPPPPRASPDPGLQIIPSVTPAAGGPHLGDRRSGHHRRVLVATLITIAAHGSAWLWAQGHRRHFEASSAGARMRAQYVVDLAQPPPPEKPSVPERPARQPAPPKLSARPRS